jgi:1-acyl-sn-glycerol-3-phosphate acyltransferase
MAPEPEDLEWRYSPSEQLDLTLVERLRHFPREPEMFIHALRSTSALAIRTWLRTYHRLSIEGREHLPAEGSCVLVANHASHLDALCLLAALPLGKLHRAFPVAAKDYFFRNLQGLSFSVILLNAVPFERGRQAGQSLALCRSLLEKPGNILIIFPEGTRTQTGELGVFKPGIGALVAGTAIPVLPCWISGAFEAFPKRAWLPRPTGLKLTIGAPRLYSELPDNREGAHRVALDLCEAVRQLGNVGMPGPSGSPENLI